MKNNQINVVFLGVGEAFDERYSTTSVLIQHEDTNLLLDCGYTAPPTLWKYNTDQTFLDAVYISHLHADHYFGIPPLIVRMREEARTAKLTFIGAEGLRDSILKIIELGYPNTLQKLKFELEFIEVEANTCIEFQKFKLEFAPTAHAIPNLAVKITTTVGANKKTICYSGDGMFTDSTVELYKNTDLLSHEGYVLEQKVGGHASIKNLITMAIQNGIKRLALVHIQRDYSRQQILAEIKQKVSELDVIIPNTLDILQI